MVGNGSGNGRAAIIKEYGNLWIGSVLAIILAVCLYFGLQMAQRFLDSQIAVFEKMAENQVLMLENQVHELEQDKRHYDQIERIFERINGDC